MQWGDMFLNFLQQHVPNRKKANKKHEVWRAKFAPASGVTLKPLDDGAAEEVSAGEDRIGFIPRWYYDTLHDLEVPNDAGLS